MTYVDFHCDTLLKACEAGLSTIKEFPQASIDGKRLSKAGVGGQFFAAFLPPRKNAFWKDVFAVEDFQKVEGVEPEDAYIQRCWQILKNTIADQSQDLVFAKTGSELKEAVKQGKTAAFFTLEDGRSVDGSLEKLKQYQEMGVSLISLTWNYENCFGYPNSGDLGIMESGLKPFGKEAVEYMNDLGIVIDVSHLSDGGFWDVVKVSRKPFLASHSNCRALSPHMRNLTDDMIRALAEKGGVAGLNFYANFLNADTQCTESRVEDMIAHIVHMVRVGGLECAAIGTDLDGIGGNLEIADPTQMELLFHGLRKAGFSQDAIECIAWKNAARVLCDIAG